MVNDRFLELPDVIRAALLEKNINEDSFCYGIKTSFKPRPHIPYIWIIVHKIGVVFCVSSKRRTIWMDSQTTNIDSLIVETGYSGSMSIRLIYSDLNTDEQIIDVSNCKKDKNFHQAINLANFVIAQTSK